MPELAYDWEMNDLTIDEEDWRKWLSPDEDDNEEELDRFYQWKANPTCSFYLDERVYLQVFTKARYDNI